MRAARRVIIFEPLPTLLNNFLPITQKPLSVNTLPAITARKPITNLQSDLFIDKQREIDGVGMGDPNSSAAAKTAAASALTQAKNKK